MSLAGLLPFNALRMIRTAPNASSALWHVCRIAENAYGIEGRAAFHEMVARDRLHAAALGHGVALPHLRTIEVDRMKCVFIWLESPVEFGAADKVPVDMVCGLFGPPGLNDEFLKALARMARLLKNSEFRSKIRAATSLDILHTILTGEPAAAVA